LKIFTDSEIADMERKFRLLQQDVKDLRNEKAELAARVRAAETRAGDAEERERMATIYAGIALAEIASMAAEAG